MAQHVKINVIARLLNMSPDAIRFYEKKGIISPPREAGSHYREYSADEIRRLYDCANWTALGFTIREVEAMMHSLDRSEVAQLLDTREQALRDQLRDTQLALDKLLGYKNGMTLSDADLNQWKWIDSEACYFYCYGHHEELNEAMIFSPRYRPVMEHRNLFTCTVVISAGTLTDQTPDLDFGFTLPAAAAEEWHFQTEEPVRYLPARRCLRTVIQTEAVLHSRDLISLRTQLEIKYAAVSGDVICRVLSLDYDQGRQTRRYELWIPAEMTEE